MYMNVYTYNVCMYVCTHTLFSHLASKLVTINHGPQKWLQNFQKIKSAAHRLQSCIQPTKMQCRAKISTCPLQTRRTKYTLLASDSNITNVYFVKPVKQTHLIPLIKCPLPLFCATNCAFYPMIVHDSLRP